MQLSIDDWDWIGVFFMNKRKFQQKESSPSNGQQVTQHAQRSPCECYAHYAANCGQQMSDEQFLSGLCTECQQLVSEVINQFRSLHGAPKN
jgi:formate-dependent nitrite reductase cytochrome c552 subunit